MDRCKCGAWKKGAYKLCYACFCALKEKNYTKKRVEENPSDPIAFYLGLEED